MDRKSWIILAICGALLLLNWHYRSADQEIKAKQAAQAQSVTPLPQAPAPIAGAAVQPAPVVLPAPPPVPGLDTVPAPATEAARETWTLSSSMDSKGGKEVARFVFTNVGGGIEYVDMVGHMVDSKLCRDQDVCINKGASAGIGTLVFGVNAVNAPFFDQGIYRRLPESTDQKLVLLGRASNGLVVRKEFTLVPQKDKLGKKIDGNAYMLALKILVENPSDQMVHLADMGVYAGLNASANATEGDMYTHFFWRANGSYTQETPSYFTGGFFGSARARALEPVMNVEYAGAMGQFFVNIVMPKDNAKGQFVYASPKEIALPATTKTAKGIEVVAALPTVDIKPKDSHVFDFDIFTGPKMNQMLGEMPGKLDAVMAYGWLTILSEPMNWLLNIFHGLFGNWGWAIIGMTFVVRGCIWPLHRKSYMSMKRMSQMQPLMKEIKEKYPDDPQKVNMEMMKLYQKYGINPVGGCLPMLIQIPIFFAFYRVLQSSTEMRGEPFILWVKDLARPDTVWDINLPFSLPFIGTELPINVLPIIMAVTMVIQMKLTPQAGDKMQQRIMNLMPLMFFAFCYNFASALALYWTTQNIISIFQTYLIRRLPEPKLEKKEKKPGFFQRMMEQQRIAMEQQKKAGQKGGGMRNVTPKK